MKNWEFYEEDIRAYEARFAVVDGKIKGCSNGICSFCAFDNEDNESCQCWDKRLDFLYREHNILTDDEKALCKLLDGGWIARDSNGDLWWYEDKITERNSSAWVASGIGLNVKMNRFFPQCKFNFIRWEDEEPWEVGNYDKENS